MSVKTEEKLQRERLLPTERGDSWDGVFDRLEVQLRYLNSLLRPQSVGAPWMAAHVISSEELEDLQSLLIDCRDGLDLLLRDGQEAVNRLEQMHEVSNVTG